MNYLADGYWDLTLESDTDVKDLSYKYYLRYEYGGGVEWEFGDNRMLVVPESQPEEIVVQDHWR